MDFEEREQDRFHELTPLSGTERETEEKEGALDRKSSGLLRDSYIGRIPEEDRQVRLA